MPPTPPGGGNRGAGGGAGKGSGGFRPRILAAVAVAAVVAIGAVFAFSQGGASDQVSQTEIDQNAAAYQTLIATGSLPLMTVAPEDVDRAIEEMPPSVTAEQKEELRSQVNEGKVQLAWLSLWDTHAQDGDILRFESSTSFPIEVMAMNAKTTLAIPYPSDGNVLVTGVTDGGGGITIGLESGATRITWPTMQPGDTLNLPVTQGF